MNIEQKNWKIKYPNSKPPLSWLAEDYKVWNADIPDCVTCGQTEGESMELEDIEDWYLDSGRTMSVLAEDYPEKFVEQYDLYLLDLEYLQSLGKIDEEQKEKMADKEKFNFG